jgi:DMSO/TMAO reductase YedYZ molybdopterin-dependent catalytic subunit
MHMLRSIQGGVLAACCMAVQGAPADAATSAVTAPPATVTVGGEVSTPLRLDAAALRKLPHHAFDASEHGSTAHWDGVAVAELLRAAGAPLGEALRGRNLALYVRISAVDGYRVVYSLAELDPAMHDGDVILADLRDGHALDAKEGPFRLVAKDDKRPARWVRQVVAIDLLAAPSP